MLLLINLCLNQRLVSGNTVYSLIFTLIYLPPVGLFLKITKKYNIKIFKNIEYNAYTNIYNLQKIQKIIPVIMMNDEH